MKKYLIMALLTVAVGLTANAQHYRDSRYYNHRTDRLDYNQGHFRDARYHDYRWGRGDAYVGFRIGPSFSTVSSDDPYLNGSSVKTGLNAGIVAGFALVPRSPLYFETGLLYTGKGGKGSYGGDKFTYNLDYLELPLVFKYKYFADNAFSIEPFLGGYVACGVGGKIKDFGMRAAYSAFSDVQNTFKRFDGGLRFGCAASFDMISVELAYDLGLTNISHNDFDECRNRALTLSIGLSF